MGKITHKTVEFESLTLNRKNFRFGEFDSEADVIQIMITDQKDKIFALAKDIAFNGLNPGESLFVAQDAKNKGRYIVLEGNRRITALKILKNPEILEQTDFSSKKTEVQGWLGNNKVQPLPDKISCVIFDDPAESYSWIEKKHIGPGKGEGVVGWPAMAKANYAMFTGGNGRSERDIGAAILNYSKTLGIQGNSYEKFPITNLGRLFSDKRVQNTTGINFKNGEFTSHNEERAKKILERILVQIGNSQIKVGHIFRKEDREDYINSILRECGFSTQGKLGISEPTKPRESMSSGLEHIAIPKPLDETTNPSHQEPIISPTRPSHKRTTLIPETYSFSIPDGKINNIFIELKGLQLPRFRNAASILFRVFLELSVDCFLAKYQPSIKVDSRKLKDKITAVYDEFGKNDWGWSDKDIKGHKDCVSSSKNSIESPDNLHQYVHRTDYQALLKDLNTIWDNYEKFLKTIWKNL